MQGLLRRHRAGAATALLLAASLAGCSNGSDDESSGTPTPSPSSSVSVSPSPSPTRTAAPGPKLPKPPPAKDDEAGQKAFAEFVIARWGYALETNDSSAMSDLSPKSGPCEGCPELETELKKRKKQGWYVDFPGAKVVKIKVGPGQEPDAHVATATINVPASTSYFKN